MPIPPWPAVSGSEALEWRFDVFEGVPVTFIVEASIYDPYLSRWPDALPGNFPFLRLSDQVSHPPPSVLFISLFFRAGCLAISCSVGHN